MAAPYPYDSPIFRRAHREASPDGTIVAEIAEAHEVSMGNPTVGVLVLSTGLTLSSCNPSFLWSSDSRHLAVPRYFRRFGVLRRQRLAVVDVKGGRVFESRDTAWYFQPEVFASGTLVALKDPLTSRGRVAWRIPEDLDRFTTSEPGSIASSSTPPTRTRRAHLQNAPGDFYVEYDCCTCCGVPEHIAPDLFASVMQNDQCFVKRQPRTEQEMGRMLTVLQHQDLGCVRYRGSDPALIQRLESEGLADLVDSVD